MHLGHLHCYLRKKIRLVAIVSSSEKGNHSIVGMKTFIDPSHRISIIIVSRDEVLAPFSG